ncbi:MAG TPA: glycosyltransferase family 2 protein [Thermoleophilaceae bacterium]|nr:glycosyltransferase family 2 protein [Thermoleophilaceae bacterium]
MLISYCVVNTSGREHLMRCLDAIERTHPDGVEREVLVLDNASDDGSADAIRERGGGIELIALTRRTGKAENDSTLLRRARGDYALLLNEDAELLPGAPRALLDALEADPGAAAAAAQLLDPSGKPQPTAWRLPGVGTAVVGALFLHRRLTVQWGGAVGWAQSSAMLVRREAAERVGFLDPRFFVYSDETDFCKRLGDAGWRILLVPEARATHHEQLSSDFASAERRIVEFHRNRHRYMLKHHSRATAWVVRLLTSWTYLCRAAVALVLPGYDPRRYLLHARQALRPWSGEGIRESAENYNRMRSRASGTPNAVP